ncbi:MAG: histidinol-phosphate aminotransferase family protein [Pseudomonadales bacterium]|nr:histidinol-phosphate aminotransferase family protein [Pseudomonadales bacterium]
MTKHLSRRALLGSAAAAGAWAAAASIAARSPKPQDPMTAADTSKPAPAASRLVRLSANENPYGPGPKARAAIAAAMPEACRYSIDSYNRLIDQLAQRENVERTSIVLGSGSGELLNMLALEYVGRGELVTAWPTFEQITTYAERLGATVRRVPLDRQMRHDLTALGSTVSANTGLLYVCNPNNPTGTVVAGETLREFCRSMANRTLVVVDEAYLDLIEPGATESMVDLARAGENVVVLRTFSKIHGLAGLRIGYGIGAAGVIKRLRRMQMAFANTLGMEAALASLNDRQFLTDTAAALAQDRARMLAACRGLGLECSDAQGNFIFVNTGMPNDQFRERMRQQQIEVGRTFEPYATWCRVTVGTTQETDRFLAALPRVAAG